MQRAAIGYVRVSTTDQTRGSSLEEQRAQIAAWATRRSIPLETIFGNDHQGESGKDMDRSALKAALDRIQRGGIGWLVVAKIDRLSRSFADATALFHRLEELGVEVVAPGDGVEQIAGGRRLMALIHAWVAEQERHRILSRVTPGLTKRVAGGMPLGRPPLGYQLVGERSQQTLAVDPTTAPIVTALFHQAAETGWGDARLSRWAQTRFAAILAERERQLAARRGRQPRIEPSLTPSTLAHLLINPVYVGILRVSVNGTPIWKPHHHTALIPESLFERVRLRREQRQSDHQQRLRAEGPSLVGGIAVCAQCGRSVIMRRGWGPDGSDHYVCMSQTTAGGPCGAASVPVAQMDNFVGMQLEELVLSQQQRMRAAITGAIDELPRHLDHVRSVASQQLAHLVTQEQQLDDRLQQGEVAIEDHARESQRFQQERLRYQEVLATTDGWRYLADLMMARHPESSSRLIWLPFIEAFTALEVADRRRLVASLTERIEIFIADFPFSKVVGRDHPTAWPLVQTAHSRALARGAGHDVAEGMMQAGWMPASADGRQWRTEEGARMELPAPMHDGKG